MIDIKIIIIVANNRRLQNYVHRITKTKIYMHVTQTHTESETLLIIFLGIVCVLCQTTTITFVLILLLQLQLIFDNIKHLVTSARKQFVACKKSHVNRRISNGTLNDIILHRKLEIMVPLSKWPNVICFIKHSLQNLFRIRGFFP